MSVFNNKNVIIRKMCKSSNLRVHAEKNETEKGETEGGGERERERERERETHKLKPVFAQLLSQQ